MKKSTSAMLLMVLALSLALPQRGEAHGGGSGWWILPAFLEGIILGTIFTASHEPPPAPVYGYPPPAPYVYPPDENPADGNAQAPPKLQAPVSQGAFAMKLVSVLKMGNVTTEAQAADILASVGIIPKDGWIVDRPMTVSIVRDLQSKVGAAATAKKIPLDKGKAEAAYQVVITEYVFASGNASPPPPAYTYSPSGGSAAGSWVTVPGMWVDGRWVPPHKAWSPDKQ